MKSVCRRGQLKSVVIVGEAQTRTDRVWQTCSGCGTSPPAAAPPGCRGSCSGRSGVSSREEGAAGASLIRAEGVHGNSLLLTLTADFELLPLPITANTKTWRVKISVSFGCCLGVCRSSRCSDSQDCQRKNPLWTSAAQLLRYASP